MAKQVVCILFSGIIFLVANSAMAQLTNSSQLDFESAKRIFDKGDFTEASKRLDRLIIAGFEGKEIYKLRGIARFKLEDYNGATQDLDKARSNDDDAEVLGILGLCKYNSREWEAAKYFLKKAVDGGFIDTKVQLYLGYLYLEGYQYKESLFYLTAAEKAGEKEIQLFESRGIAAFYEKQYDLAIKDLEKFLKTEKGSLVDYEVLGLAYAASNKPFKALPLLAKADSLGSVNKQVYFHLGNCLAEKKLYTQAITAYTRSIDLNYGDMEVYINRGNAKISAGLFKESLKDFDKSIAMAPSKSIGYRSRAAAHDQLENWAGVITDLTIANALEDFQPSDRITLSNAKFNLKNFQGALDDVTAALTKGLENSLSDGKMSSLYLQKGRCLLALKKFDDAIMAFNQAEKTGETDVELNIQRARAWVGTQNFEPAIADLETAQKSNPKNATVFYNSAIIKEEIGDFGAAVIDYSKAIALNPKDDLAFYGRANCKARKGEIAEALVDMDEAIKLNDKHAAYYKLRANFYYQMNNKDKACFDWRRAVEFGDEKARYSIEQYCNKK